MLFVIEKKKREKCERIDHWECEMILNLPCSITWERPLNEPKPLKVTERYWEMKKLSNVLLHAWALEINVSSEEQ